LIRLNLLQDKLVQSGLVKRDQLSIHIANGQPYYEPETEDHMLMMKYDAALFIQGFNHELHLLALILAITLQELWPTHCMSAELGSIETDPLDSHEYNVAAVIQVTEKYDLVKATPAALEDPKRQVLNINGLDFELTQTMPPTPLPVFAGLVNLTEHDAP